jgi:ATP-dependent DNA helicase RecG
MAEHSVDLEQLYRRESEQTEWKENVANPNDVVRCLAAFANDLSNLGGGYVVCGAAEEKDAHGFPRLKRTGIDAARLKQIEGMVLTRCRERVYPGITPLVEELPAETPDRRILVFIQPATSHAHDFREDGTSGKYYVRVSRDTIEARNGVFRELLVRKGDLLAWDHRICPGATVEDLDLLALRDALIQMGLLTFEGDISRYVSDSVQVSPLVPPLLARESLTGILRPRNFAVLLFGRNITRFVPGAVTLLSIYPGIDRTDTFSDRHEITGTLVEQTRQLQSLLSLQVKTVMDKSNLQHPNTQTYPERALLEAVSNLLAHRSYEMVDPGRITVFRDRIEFRSPGALLRGVELSALEVGTAGPVWRNQGLAYFFMKLQLAQAEGQGIPTILSSMKAGGSAPPQFSATQAFVLCVLPNRSPTAVQ